MKRINILLVMPVVATMALTGCSFESFKSFGNRMNESTDLKSTHNKFDASKDFDSLVKVYLRRPLSITFIDGKKYSADNLSNSGHLLVMEAGRHEIVASDIVYGSGQSTGWSGNNRVTTTTATVKGNSGSMKETRDFLARHYYRLEVYGGELSISDDTDFLATYDPNADSDYRKQTRWKRWNAAIKKAREYADKKRNK